MSDEKKPVFFESFGVLLHKSPQWAIDLFGFEENHMGDAGSNTAFECIRLDTNEYMEKLRELLIEGKRWPDELQDLHKDRISKNRLQWTWERIWIQIFDSERHPWRTRWSKITRFFGLKKETMLYRSQDSHSRDPYTWYFCAVAHLGLDSDPDYWITPVNMPIGLRRRGLMAWRKYLETREQKYFDKYERIALWQLRLPRRVFALDQAKMRATVVGSTKVLALIKKLTPIPNKG